MISEREKVQRLVMLLDDVEIRREAGLPPPKEYDPEATLRECRDTIRKLAREQGYGV